MTGTLTKATRDLKTNRTLVKMIGKQTAIQTKTRSTRPKTSIHTIGSLIGKRTRETWLTPTERTMWSFTLKTKDAMTVAAIRGVAVAAVMGVAKETGTAPSAAAPITRETRYVTSKSASGQPENLTLSQGKLGTVKRGMKTSYSHLGTRKKLSPLHGRMTRNIKCSRGGRQ